MMPIPLYSLLPTAFYIFFLHPQTSAAELSGTAITPAHHHTFNSAAQRCVVHCLLVSQPQLMPQARRIKAQLLAQSPAPPQCALQQLMAAPHRAAAGAVAAHRAALPLPLPPSPLWP